MSKFGKFITKVLVVGSVVATGIAFYMKFIKKNDFDEDDDFDDFDFEDFDEDDANDSEESEREYVPITIESADSENAEDTATEMDSTITDDEDEDSVSTDDEDSSED